MSKVITGSVVLAVLVSLTLIVLIATGLHLNVMAAQVVSLLAFIGFNIAVVIWVLNAGASENGYATQLGHSALLGLIAGALIFLTSWLTLAVLFPDALGQMSDSAIAFLESSGLSEEQVETQIQAIQRATPVSQSLPGLFGTFGTSTAVGAVVAIFKRKNGMRLY